MVRNNEKKSKQRNGRITRIDHLFNAFKSYYTKCVANGLFKNMANGSIFEHDHVKVKKDKMDYEYIKKYTHKPFIEFYRMNIEELNELNVVLKDDDYCMLMFDFIKICDPTNNKQNVFWYIKNHKGLLNKISEYHSIKELNLNDLHYPYCDEIEHIDINDLELKAANFYEDIFYRGKTALSLMERYKINKKLPQDKRDISYYADLHELEEVLSNCVEKEEIIEDLPITSNATQMAYDFNENELISINNFINNTNLNNAGKTELCFEGKNWYVLISHNFESNKVIGKYSSWCTKTSESTFRSYNSRGPLYVLVKKGGYNSESRIRTSPQSRLQFNFGEISSDGTFKNGQFMDANDRFISLSDLFSTNIDILGFFFDRELYKIIEISDKLNENIDILMDKLGKYGVTGDNMIGIIKKYNLNTLNIKPKDKKSVNGYDELISLKHLHINNINNVIDEINLSNFVNLETLHLENFNITKLNGIEKCVNLKKIYLKNFPKLYSLNSLKSSFELTQLDVINCPKLNIDTKIFVNSKLNILFTNIINGITVNPSALPKLNILYISKVANDVNISYEDLINSNLSSISYLPNDDNTNDKFSSIINMVNAKRNNINKPTIIYRKLAPIVNKESLISKFL